MFWPTYQRDNTMIHTIPLNTLRGKAHPEGRVTPLESLIHTVRGKRQASAITHQGAILAFVLPALPETLDCETEPVAYPLNAASLTPDWFSKPYGAWQCTRHGRFACWMLQPHLAAHVPGL
jgi:hypothetical protein